MTALEYMEKQVQKHRQDYIREYSRFAPQKMLDNILMKVNYYELACEALSITRCKDCRNWDTDDCYHDQGWCPVVSGYRTGNWFCAEGKKKSDE